MSVGAIGAYAGISFNPYVYNTNQLNGASLSKVSAIPQDALASKKDYTNLSKENINPLRPGETKNFADVLAQQLQMAQNNAARIMKPAEEMMQGAMAQ